MINLDVLYKIQYGIYLVTTESADKCNGQIVTTVFQVTAEPIQIAVCISKNTYTYELLQQSKKLGVSILQQDTPQVFIGQFGFRTGRSCDKFVNVETKIGEFGCPLVLTNSIALMEAEIIRDIDLGTHSMLIGVVKSAEKLKDAEALTYEYYHNVIKGKSPANAPTYQAKK